MLTHRSPAASTSSTLGVSGSAGRATTSVRVRAPRRSGRGRLGIRTEGVVGRHRGVSWYLPGRTHPEGWRDWPREAPATNRQYDGNGANSCSDVAGLPEVLASWSRSEDPHGCHQPPVQGMSDDVPPRGAVRLRAVLRAR